MVRAYANFTTAPLTHSRERANGNTSVARMIFVTQFTFDPRLSQPLDYQDSCARRTCWSCCAPAMSGHAAETVAATPPISVMNSRLLIATPQGLDSGSYQLSRVFRKRPVDARYGCPFRKSYPDVLMM